MKHTGHTTVEYALCLALMSILGMGSLKLLGGNVSQLLGTPTNTQNAGKINQLFALIGAEGPKGSNSSAPTGSGQGSTPQTNTTANAVKMQLQLDPATGQMVIVDTAGGGKNTTSVAGNTVISMLAQQLGPLSEVKMANGASLPDDVKGLILRLMQDGVQLSDAYNNSTDELALFKSINASNQASFKETTPILGRIMDLFDDRSATQYPQSVMDMMGTNLSIGLQFQKDYTTLMKKVETLVKTDPSITASLLTPLTQISGAITSVAYNNMTKPVLSNIDIDAVDPATFHNAYNQSPQLQKEFALAGLCKTTTCKEKLKDTIASVALKTQVGSVPTANTTLTIALNPNQTTAPASSTISGATPSGNTSTSVGITGSEITANTTVTP